MSNQGLAAVTGIGHVRLTVTDIARSKAFYQQLLGAAPAMDFSEQSEQAGVSDDPARLYGGCVFAVGDQLLGLRPVATAADRFDSTRVGLDHVSLSVGSVDDLRDAAGRLQSAGVAHGEVTELSEAGMAILSLQDPDDINVELVTALPG